MQLPLFPVLIATTAILFAACSSKPSTPAPWGETTRSSTHQKGVPGGVVVETTQLEATVANVDPATREITLTNSDGQSKTIRCGPEVANFEQIRAGDRVKVTMVSRLELSMATADTPAMAASLTQASVAPLGAKPGVIVSESQEYLATIASLNSRRHEVTLRFPDDTTRRFSVRPDIDLSQRQAGEQVSVRVSVALSIVVQNP